MSNAPVRNLRTMLRQFRERGELVCVSARVSSDQEIAEIHRRVIAARGPALLFTNVEGSGFPVATNLFGTKERTELAFGRRPLDFVRDAARFAFEALPPTPAKLWEFKHLGFQGLRVGLKRGRGGPVLDAVQRPARLTELPLLKLWPDDGGHFVTLPLVHTQHPEDGKPNLGMYRMQRYDDRTTGMHWQIGKGGGFHYGVAEAKNRALPVNVYAGGPPALILSAIAPLPEGIPELLLASLLLGERLPLCENPSGPLPLVAEAEFALVGEVAPRLRRPEGPFGDHYGYYSLTHDYPVFQVRAVHHRRNAIWPATVVGKPRQEDFFIGDFLQELLSPLFPLVMPTVRDLWSYGETGFHALSAAVVRDRYAREAMSSAFRILGEGQLSLTKFLIAIDQPVPLRDFRRVLQHLLERTNPETDLYIFGNLSMDTLDYAGPEVNKGSKGVWLGLGEKKRELPGEFRGDLPQGARDPLPFCPGCLVVGGAPYAEEPEQAKRIAADPAFQGWQLLVLCDNPRQATASVPAFLWTAFTRFEPAADIHAASERLVRRHVAFSAPVVIDARMKPWYPPEVFAAEDVKKRVTERWREYFPGGKVEMGDSDYGDLLG
ncbi:MAG: UbiD family decarboxylase [Candidatus Sumerlaeia bacterium]|nr:UbiD family decarboxylase [Candidatus Sumerlaeia bacterium]